MAGTNHDSFTHSNVVSYRERLNRDPRWALSEGGLHFEGGSKVQIALRRIATRLNELGVPYAVAGGMALFQHGYRRFTDDIDMLVTRDGLEQIHNSLDGLGYVRPFSKSKNLRETDTGVSIEFLIAGQFPGDGKPKPVAFPDPANVAIDKGGMQVLSLPALIELKLASGMTGAGRRKDLGDVQELIKYLRLPASFADQLHEYVKPMFVELWNEVAESIQQQQSPDGN